MDCRGSVIRRILGAYCELEAKPEFYSGVDSFLVTLPNISYKSVVHRQHMEEKYSKKTLQQLQVVLDEMTLGEKYTTTELMRSIPLSQSRIRQLLNILVELKRVNKIGGNRYRYYSRVE